MGRALRSHPGPTTRLSVYPCALARVAPRCPRFRRLEVVKLSEARRGFVLLSRRWVVERSLAWTRRFRRLARDFERLPETLAGLHVLAFVIVLLRRFVSLDL